MSNECYEDDNVHASVHSTTLQHVSSVVPAKRHPLATPLIHETQCKQHKPNVMVCSAQQSIHYT